MSTAPRQLPALPDFPPVSPALGSRVGHLLARAHFFVRDYADEVLEPLGLVIRQFAALALLGAEGPLSQQALGERIACDRTTMVELMDELESRGLTERRRNPSDRRAYAIELTEHGRSVLADAQERLGEAEEAMFAPLSPEERERLRGLLLRLLRA